MVHEAGHLATAKIFKVYCFEYAIGFGPKLFSKKRKNGETYFSIRAIPFGGFVSMYGEEESIPEGFEGIQIDPKRSLLAVAKWKRAIIYAAGVIMNFILALVIFFVYEVAFPTHVGRYAHVNVSNDSIAYNAGIRSGDTVYASICQTGDNAFIFYDEKAVLTYPSGTVEVFFGFDYNSLTIKDTSLLNHAVAYQTSYFGNYILNTYPSKEISEVLSTDYSSDAVINEEITGFINGFGYKKEGNSYIVQFHLIENFAEENPEFVVAEMNLSEEYFKIASLVPINSEITVAGDIYEKEVDGKKYKFINVSEEYLMPYPNVLGNNLLNHFYSGYPNQDPSKISFTLSVQDPAHPVKRGTSHILNDVPLTKNGNNYTLPNNIGLSMKIDEVYNKFGEAIVNTFEDWGNSATLIVRGLGHLFTKDGWRDVGGIIAIGYSTTQMLQQNGFGMYLYYWGLISVNLGIVNLLPFPGLDGWHLVVLAVESITRKEIPPKVKNIVSAVGVILLFALMVLIIIKDIIGLV